MWIKININLIKININLIKSNIDLFETNTKLLNIKLVLTRTLLYANKSTYIHFLWVTIGLLPSS